MELWPSPTNVDFCKLPEVPPNEFSFCADDTGTFFQNEAQFLKRAGTPLQVWDNPVGRIMRPGLP